MTLSVLFVLDEGFDDMVFLSCQVILEESGHDIIISSKNGGTLKGENSSVITVSLEDAMQQSINYSGLVVIGGKNLNNWTLLTDLVRQFTSQSKLIGIVSDYIYMVENQGFQINREEGIFNENNIVCLNDLNEAENFAETLSATLNR